jgi:hypothetical protein
MFSRNSLYSERTAANISERISAFNVPVRTPPHNTNPADH